MSGVSGAMSGIAASLTPPTLSACAVLVVVLVSDGCTDFN